MTPKVLVVGAIRGHLRTAVDKMSKMHAKNDFSFAIVIGDLFSDDTGERPQANEELNALLHGSLAIPLPTYFTVGDLPLPAAVMEKLEANDEVCANLFYLGRKGRLKTADGISIVALGGRLVQNDGSVTHAHAQALGKYDPLYLDSEVRGLFGAHQADILVTNQWPADITTGSTQLVPETLRTDQGVTSISTLCATLKPRYHFSSSPAASWEREPFVHPAAYDSLDEKAVTRFRALASIEKSSKEWVSAFTLDPTAPPAAAPGATSPPFRLEASTASRKRKGLEGPGESYSRYQNGDHYSERHGRPPKRSRGVGQHAKDQCFFCVANPEFNGHMVVSIGDHSIVTVPKGPLPLPDTFPSLSASGHALIIPQYHAADEMAGALRDPTEFDAEFAEMTRYRKALCQMLQSKSHGRLGAVCWDANRTGIRHMHWQFMPAPVDLVRKGLVEAAFKAVREKHQYPPFQSCHADSKLPRTSDYFRLWIWAPPEPSADPVEEANRVKNGDEADGTEKSLFFPLPSHERFNIWFGREVMAKLLKLENRVDWKLAEQSFEDESRDVEAFKNDFHEFDFAMTTDADNGDGAV